MPHFRIAYECCDVDRVTKKGPEWKRVEKFNSKDRIVDERGNVPGKDYKGRTYRIIFKQEKTYSGAERAGRAFIATIAAIMTLGLALILKAIRDLYTKEKDTHRVGLFQSLEPSSSTSSSDDEDRSVSDDSSV